MKEWASCLTGVLSVLLECSVVRAGTVAGPQGDTYRAAGNHTWQDSAVVGGKAGLFGISWGLSCALPALVVLVMASTPWAKVDSVGLWAIVAVAYVAGAKHLHEGAHRRAAWRVGAAPQVNGLSNKATWVLPRSVGVTGITPHAYERFVLAPVRTTGWLGAVAFGLALLTSQVGLTEVAFAATVATVACGAGLMWDLMAAAELRLRVQPAPASPPTVITDIGKGAQWGSDIRGTIR